MNAVNILIGLMPMIGWGLFPVIVGKIGGKPASQIIGTTLGTLILAIIVAIFRGTPIPETKTFIFLFNFRGLLGISADYHLSCF